MNTYRVIFNVKYSGYMDPVKRKWFFYATGRKILKKIIAAFQLEELSKDFIDSISIFEIKKI